MMRTSESEHQGRLDFALTPRQGAAMDDRTAPAGRYPREIGLGAVRHDWTRARGEGAVRAALSRTDLSRPKHSSPPFRSQRGADFDAALDQDRRLSGGLRLLPPERALRHRRQGGEADGGGCGPRRGAGGEERRREPLLHGRGLARAEGSRSRQGVRDGRRRQSARARDLRDARHAHRRAGATSQGGRPRLLQPQPRHLAGLLRRDHHHAHLRGSPRHARSRARRPAFTSAAAASSAWARAPRIAWA